MKTVIIFILIIVAIYLAYIVFFKSKKVEKIPTVKIIETNSNKKQVTFLVNDVDSYIYKLGEYGKSKRYGDYVLEYFTENGSVLIKVTKNTINGNENIYKKVINF